MTPVPRPDRFEAVASSGNAGVESPIAQARRLITEVPGPRSRQLMSRRHAAVSPGVSSSLPIYIEAASGAIVVDVDGNAFIDLGSGIGVTSIGHTVPQMVDAVSAQAARFAHTCFMVGPYESLSLIHISEP